MCHAGTGLNAGPGSVSATFNGQAFEDFTYTPGDVVPVVVTVTDPDASQTVRGFEVSARTPEGCFQAGGFAPVEEDALVQVRPAPPRNVPAPCPGSPLMFATHNMPKMAEEGAATFMFNWTTPATNVGPIVFAVAGNAADGDGGRMGDRIYTTSGQINATGINPVNAASGIGPNFASNQIVSIFVPGIAAEDGTADMTPLPETLADVSGSVTDSSGATTALQFFHISSAAGQANALIPDGVAAGAAMLTLQPATGDAVETPIQIAPVAPGIFSADGTGSGQAAAIAVRVAEDSSETPIMLLDETGAAIPLDVSGDGQIVVLLFGTGLRGGDAQPTATVDGEPAAVVGFGESSEFDGLDQVNVLVTPEQAAAAVNSVLTIQVVVDGVPANAVTVAVAQPAAGV